MISNADQRQSDQESDQGHSAQASSGYRRDTRVIEPSSQKGYPLAAVFVLVTTVAVVAALVQSGVRLATLENGDQGRRADTVVPPPAPRSVDRIDLSALGVALAILGCVLGAGIGMSSPYPLRGVVTGLVVGPAVGLAAALLAIHPPSLWAVLIGCSVLIATAMIVRIASRGKKAVVVRGQGRRRDREME